MSRDPARLDIYCLDVGQGDCTVILPPEGQGDPILFDCADAYVAQQFFANHGVRRLSAVVVSHLDQDHIAGVLPFLKQFFQQGGTLGELVISLDRTNESQEALQLLNAVIAWEGAPPCQGFRVTPPMRDRVLASGTGWDVTLVLPFWGDALQASRRNGQANTASAVLRVARAGAAVLLGGDAELRAWERLDDPLRPAKVIRTPHHGGKLGPVGSLWQGFHDLYDAVGADHAVVSVGTTNRHQHPLPEHIIAARRSTQCRVLCTQMTAQCHGNLDQVRRSAVGGVASSIEPPYRHQAVPGDGPARRQNEVPCAGTVLISLDALGQVSVQPKAKHEGLVATLSSPLCGG
jgi:beta-lactamase superfamily II metal-dependent hydrolase